MVAPKTKSAEAETVAAPRLMLGNDKTIAPAIQVPKLEGAAVSFSFEDAPVADVVRTILGDVLKVSYVLHPPIAGTVTLSTRSAVEPDQAVFLLEAALQANGLVMSRDARGTFHVGRTDALRAIGGSVRQAIGNTPMPPGYGAIVVPLQFIGAAEMATILRPMMAQDALVRVDNVRNLLVLMGTRTQAEGWLDLVNTFDVDLLKGMSVGVFPLKHVSVAEVEAALRLVGGGGQSAAPASPGAPQGQRGNAAAPAAVLMEGNPFFGALRIMPIERINSILVVTPRAAYLEEARRWIERLDQPNDNSGEAQLHIYKVQNTNAKHLAALLSGIFSDGKSSNQQPATSGVAPGLSTVTGGTSGNNPSPFGQPVAGGVPSAGLGFGSRAAGTNGGIGGSLGASSARSTSAAAGQQAGGGVTALGSIRVMADELNNSVLVWSTKAEFSRIEATLKRLDLPPTQVLIEASIMEVTLNDNLEYGLQWAFNDSPGSSGYTGSGLLTSNTETSGAFNPIGAGFSYALSNPAAKVRAILTALSGKTSVKVIASPSLMVLDNHQASISVGTQQPVQAGETVNTEGTVRSTNIQYKDTGVNLMVTPSVNSGNIVTMQIDQAVTDVGPQDLVTKQRSFLQRQISSKVAVRTGESIVMGGLIQETASTSKSGIPLLHEIPVLGNLFGNTSTTGVRTELLVVITPRVVRSDVDIRDVSDDLRRRLMGLKAFSKPVGELPQVEAVSPKPAVQ